MQVGARVDGKLRQADSDFSARSAEATIAQAMQKNNAT
jgi:hypothetical protein